MFYAGPYHFDNRFRFDTFGTVGISQRVKTFNTV